KLQQHEKQHGKRRDRADQRKPHISQGRHHGVSSSGAGDVLAGCAAPTGWPPGENCRICTKSNRSRSADKATRGWPLGGTVAMRPTGRSGGKIPPWPVVTTQSPVETLTPPGRNASCG